MRIGAHCSLSLYTHKQFSKELEKYLLFNDLIFDRVLFFTVVNTVCIEVSKYQANKYRQYTVYTFFSPKV